MKKIFWDGGNDIPTPISTKLLCTLKELKYFATKSLWNKKYRYPWNSIKQEFIECFDPLTW